VLIGRFQMASKAAHDSTGWAAGVIAAAVIAHVGAQGPWFCWSVAAVITGYLGGTAPDWLEVAWWTGNGQKKWIAHRTWTHWGVAWLGGLAAAYYCLGKHPGAAIGLGFAAGGVMHLLADYPNPRGIPWLLTKRYSLGWWKSGKCDWVVVMSAWIAATVVVDNIWLQGRLQLYAFALASHLSSDIAACSKAI
jgi:membrane-bound metal-dependent hydrolase YbcI (DUF457 family)